MTDELQLFVEPGEALAAALSELGYAARRWTAALPAPALLIVPAEQRKTLQRVRSARQQCPSSALVVLGKAEDPSEIVAAARAGALDWLELPLERERVAGLLAEIEMRQRLSADRRSLLSDLTQQGETRESERRELQRQLAAMAERLENSNRELGRAHEALQQRVAQLGTLYRIGRDLSVQRNWDAALDSLLERLCEVLAAGGAALLLYSRRGERLAARSARSLSGGSLREASALLLARSQQLERQSDLFALVALREEGEALCERRNEPWRETVMPLRHRDQPLGHLLFDKEYANSAAFEEDRFFLRSFQAMLAEAVATAQAVNELRRLEEFHRRILDHVGSAVFTLDRNGSVRFANRRAIELLGSDGEGRSVDAFLRVGGERLLATRWAAELQAGEQRVAEGWLQAADGSEIPVSLLLSLLPDENPATRPLLLVAEDRRQKRALEAERRRAAHQDELLIMAAEWAHDVRTPLTGILHGAELLAEGLAPQADGQRHFELIRSEVRRLDELVANFLDFARPAHLKLAREDLRPLLEELMVLQTGAARDRGVVLDADLALPTAWIRCDRDALKQALLNLVTNAVEASPPEGRVIVRLRPSDEPLEGPLLDGRGDAVALEIEDQGPGIAAKHLDRLFIPFFTTKQNGTGLGLAICEKIARAHHGHLRYERRGDRTVFRMLLPEVQPESAEFGAQSAGG